MPRTTLNITALNRDCLGVTQALGSILEVKPVTRINRHQYWNYLEEFAAKEKAAIEARRIKPQPVSLTQMIDGKETIITTDEFKKVMAAKVNDEHGS